MPRKSSFVHHHHHHHHPLQCKLVSGWVLIKRVYDCCMYVCRGCSTTVRRRQSCGRITEWWNGCEASTSPSMHPTSAAAAYTARSWYAFCLYTQPQQKLRENTLHVLIVCTGLPLLLKSPGKKFPFSKTCKILENRVGPWKFWNLMAEGRESPWISVVHNHCYDEVKILQSIR